MAIAAVTPRVRSMVICDDVSASDIEDGVFTLEGVRQQLRARSIPCRVSIRYVKFAATFWDDNVLLPLYVEFGGCVFPEAGQYNFEVYFSGRGGGEALKAEHPFLVHEE